MKFAFEVQHRSGQKQMAADALFLLPTSQTDNFDIDEDIPEYRTADAHFAIDHSVEEEVKPSIVQSFL